MSGSARLIMQPTVTGILFGLLVVGGLIALAERLWPSVRGQRFLRRGFLLDLAYWFFTPLVTRAITRSAAIIAFAGLVLAFGMTLERASFEALLAGHGPLAAQSRWLQAIELLIVLDFLGYWMHRFFHGTWAWPFHEIHHSSEDLDWLSAVRVHPVNDMVGRIVPAIFVVLAGFSPLALAGVLPLLGIYAILLHANVTWDFGPFRRVIASPAFHRWHHASAEEGRDRNFAGLLPLWDILFGTYYMPAHAPTRFGVDRPVPGTLWGQLLWPFRAVARR
jgi:sterol desaturase/sphingolipid hydroxylase (fatty acid hydroxylase superfamily)